MAEGPTGSGFCLYDTPANLTASGLVIRGGPYDNEVICQQSCQNQTTPPPTTTTLPPSSWYCVDKGESSGGTSGSTLDCYYGSLQEIATNGWTLMSGPYNSDQDCLDACEEPAWYCVYQGQGVTTCMYGTHKEITDQTNMAGDHFFIQSGPYATEADCTPGCEDTTPPPTTSAPAGWYCVTEGTSGSRFCIFDTPAHITGTSGLIILSGPHADEATCNSVCPTTTPNPYAYYCVNTTKDTSGMFVSGAGRCLQGNYTSGVSTDGNTYVTGPFADLASCENSCNPPAGILPAPPPPPASTAGAIGAPSGRRTRARQPQVKSTITMTTPPPTPR